MFGWRGLVQPNGVCFSGQTGLPTRLQITFARKKLASHKGSDLCSRVIETSRQTALNFAG